MTTKPIEVRKRALMDPEIRATGRILAILKELDPRGRRRVLSILLDRANQETAALPPEPAPARPALF